MYVQDFLPAKEDVLAKALQLPKARNGDVEAVMRVVGDVVRAEAVQRIEKEVSIDLMDAVVMYEITNGDYKDIPEGDEHERQRHEYESGMDDAVEAAFGKYEDELSQDWLGRETINTGLWESTEDDRSAVEKLAKSAAKEIWKQLTYDKTPAQILASAGIVKTDVASAMETRNEEGNPVTEQSDLEGVIARIHKHVGKDFDQLSVYEDLQTICEEDDEILASSSASRLGLTEADVNTLQIAAITMEDPASEIVALVSNPPKDDKKTSKKADKPKAEKTGNEIDKSVFEALKECGAGDTAMAEALGNAEGKVLAFCRSGTRSTFLWALSQAKAGADPDEIASHPDASLVTGGGA